MKPSGALKILVSNLVLLIGLVGILELGLRFAAKPQSSALYPTERSNSYIEDDIRFGYRPRANESVEVKRGNSERTIYKARYRFDGLRRRITPQANVEQRKHFAAFIGGSNTFGEGLRQDQTLPYFFADLAANYRSYNYAFPGYGPQHALAVSELDSLTSEIKERQGFFLYQYFSFHRNRLLGTASFLANVTPGYPKYILDDEGRIVFAGSFTDGHSWQDTILGVLGRSKLFQWFEADYPPIFSNKSSELLCKLLKQTEENFQEKFPQARFIVIIGNKSEPEDPIAKDCLEPEGIAYIDLLRELPHLHGPPWVILPHIENHYNAKANKLIAQALYSYLKNRFEGL